MQIYFKSYILSWRRKKLWDACHHSFSFRFLNLNCHLRIELSPSLLPSASLSPAGSVQRSCTTDGGLLLDLWRKPGHRRQRGEVVDPGKLRISNQKERGDSLIIVVIIILPTFTHSGNKLWRTFPSSISANAGYARSQDEDFLSIHRTVLAY